MINLYIIDDHHLIIEGLYSSFDLESSYFNVVGGSLTIADALVKIPTSRVDIIILDLFIYNTDPVANLSLIRKSCPGIPIVILSQESSLNWQIEMFLHGVKAYITKGEDATVMRQKLLSVSMGETIMPNEVSELIVKGEKSLSRTLSPDLKEIIRLLLKGLVVKEIAVEMKLTESSIEKKLKKLREMYRVRNNYELLLNCYTKHPADWNSRRLA